MAEHLLNDQQQQQPHQIQPYGVDFGARAKARGVPYLPHVPATIGAPNFRARQLPEQPVREQQEVMLQDENMLVNQPMIQHNLQQQQQDNIAYSRRQYDQLHTPAQPGWVKMKPVIQTMNSSDVELLNIHSKMSTHLSAVQSTK